MAVFAPTASRQTGELSGALPRSGFCSFVQWVSEHNGGAYLGAPGDRPGHLRANDVLRPERIAPGRGTLWRGAPNWFPQLREINFETQRRRHVRETNVETQRRWASPRADRTRLENFLARCLELFCSSLLKWVSKHNAVAFRLGKENHLVTYGGLRPDRIAPGWGPFWRVAPNCFLQLREIAFQTKQPRQCREVGFGTRRRANGGLRPESVAPSLGTFWRVAPNCFLQLCEAGLRTGRRTLLFRNIYHFRAPGDLLVHELLVPGQALDIPGERLGHAPEPSPEEGGAAEAETQGKVGF